MIYGLDGVEKITEKFAASADNGIIEVGQRRHQKTSEYKDDNLSGHHFQRTYEYAHIRVSRDGDIGIIERLDRNNSSVKSYKEYDMHIDREERGFIRACNSAYSTDVNLKDNEQHNDRNRHRTNSGDGLLDDILRGGGGRRGDMDDLGNTIKVIGNVLKNFPF